MHDLAPFPFTRRRWAPAGAGPGFPQQVNAGQGGRVGGDAAGEALAGPS